MIDYVCVKRVYIFMIRDGGTGGIGGRGALCVEISFTLTFHRIQNVTVKLKSELILYFSISLLSLQTPSQSVSHKRFHPCENHRKAKFEPSFANLLLVVLALSRDPFDSGSIRYFKY